jgi:hypothetical protein
MPAVSMQLSETNRLLARTPLSLGTPRDMSIGSGVAWQLRSGSPFLPQCVHLTKARRLLWVESDWKPTALQPLPKQLITDGRPTNVKLVPYGCTKFRVSMFPVSAP